MTSKISSLSAAGSPVNHFPVPGSEEARKMTVISGLKCSVLSRHTGPFGCLVKMLLVSSVWNSTKSLLIWKIKDISANRSLFQLARSMPRMKGKGSGFWPTTSTRDWKDTPGMARQSVNKDGTIRNRIDQLARRVFSETFPTPSTMDTIIRKTMRPSRAATNRKTGYLSETIHGELNPEFVEWLMGFPTGWTDLKR